MRKSRKSPTVQPIHKGHLSVSNKRYLVLFGYFADTYTRKKTWLGFTKLEKGPKQWYYSGCGYYSKKRSQLQALENFSRFSTRLTVLALDNDYITHPSEIKIVI